MCRPPVTAHGVCLLHWPLLRTGVVPSCGESAILAGMADAWTLTQRWFRLTPDRLILGLLAVEGFLFLSERFRWFAFNQHKGWTVLIAVASVGVAMLLMLAWLAAGLAFRWRFQFSIRSLLVLTLAVAIPCSWLSWEMKKAGKQQEAVQEIRKLGGRVIYDYWYHQTGNPPGTGPYWYQRGCGICWERISSQRLFWWLLRRSAIPAWSI